MGALDKKGLHSTQINKNRLSQLPLNELINTWGGFHQCFIAQLLNVHIPKRKIYCQTVSLFAL